MSVFTVKQASNYSGKTERAIRQACQRGTLRARKHGRDWAITKADLDAYLANPPKPGPKRR